MRKYFASRHDFTELEEYVVDIHHAITVFEPDATPQKTGLLDKDGTPIYRVDELDPIGFLRKID